MNQTKDEEMLKNRAIRINIADAAKDGGKHAGLGTNTIKQTHFSYLMHTQMHAYT